MRATSYGCEPQASGTLGCGEFGNEASTERYPDRCVYHSAACNPIWQGRGSFLDYFCLCTSADGGSPACRWVPDYG
ncbi:MAG: hypothetical protein HY898_14360 [Deltaproteobacteria bacterium]|nr:hypothetical protein [Deltaproteobacteria bacterium]